MVKVFYKKLWRFILKNIPADINVRLRYFRNYKKLANLKHPLTFNEKVLRRIINDKNPRYVELADKLLVRNFIRNKIGDNVLIPLILDTNKPDELFGINDWSGLVIKPNHGTGVVEIFDENPIQEVKHNIVDKAYKWLKTDFSKVSGEWHYAMIEPSILVEKKITNEGEIPKDYKFHVFKQYDGTIQYVLQIVDGRFGNESMGYYLNSFENLIRVYGEGDFELSNAEKYSLNTVIKYNEILMGDEFKYARIDWYIVDGKIYFGEMTFTPGAGCSVKFGSELELLMAKLWVD